MARPVPSPQAHALADLVVETPGSSVLDLLDRLLDKGAVLDGDVTLGLAGVDLVYVRLSAVLGAADRLLPQPARDLARRKRSRR